MTSFRWEDPDGCVLTATSSTIPSTARIVAEDPVEDAQVCVIVPQAQVPWVASGLTAIMHKAAGLPVPLILPASSRDPAQLTLASDGVTVDPSGDPARPVALGIRGATSRLTPAVAREVAAALALTADEADADPVRRDVCDLADLICTFGGAEEGRRAARAILARGYRLEERAR